MSPPSLAHHFLTAAYQNAWANHRLLRACGELSHSDFAATRTSFFPSIKATLNHILTVDWFYLEMFERSFAGLPPHQDPRRFFEPREPFDSCEELSKAQHEADRRLIAFCQGMTDERLDDPMQVPRISGVIIERFGRLLAHVFEHQIHHRGQVHAMLAGTRVKPPALDEFYCTNEDVLRAPDFAELGFTEEAIWGERARPPA